MTGRKSLVTTQSQVPFTPPAAIGTYTYNGKGERVKKVAGNSTTVYHYDFDGKLIGESLISGTMLKEYLYIGQVRIAMVDVPSGKISYYLNDRLVPRR